jgi:Ca2+-binding RTX toxin-like protein
VAGGAQKLLAGGAGDDTYKLIGGLTGQVTLVEDATTFVGGTITSGGSDTVDFSAFTTGVTFDLSSAVNPIDGLELHLKDLQGADAPLHFENVTGGSGDDTLKGNRLANVIHGGAGSNDLYGGSGNDTYVFVPVGSGVTTHLYESAGTASLGLVTSGGTDTLDFSALTTGVIFNLSTGAHSVSNNQVLLWNDADQTAPLPQLFENIIGALAAANVLTGNLNDNLLVGGNLIDIVNGQDGADILIGLDGADSLDGDVGRDVLIGGRGADTIFGGGGDDILIGGYTAYDEAPARRDLETIRRAWLWSGTGNDYANRVDRIMRGIGLGKPDPAFPGPGLRATPPNQTVFDDNDKDPLTGGRDFDWFLKGAGDLLGVGDTDP